VSTVVAFGCTPFHTADTEDAAVSHEGGAFDAGALHADGGAIHDAGLHREGATLDGSASVVVDATVDAPATLDTVCGYPWSEVNMCTGRSVSVLGSVQFSDDPRISFARSEGGTLGICYADDSNDDFLTRYVRAVTFKAPGLSIPQPTAVTLFMGSESDTTPACAIGGGAGDTFHVLVNDTDDEVLGYGELVGGTMPAYNLFGPSPIDGYLTLGVVAVDPAHVMAAVGDNVTETIQSYLVTPYDGGANIATPATVESSIGISLLGAGQFSLRSGGAPEMLIDMEPGDAAGSRADLAVWNGSSWKVQTIEGNALDAAIGYGPSLAVTDGGFRAVYYEQNPGTSDAGTSQIHVATFSTLGGAPTAITRPIDASLDNDPSGPLVGAAAAVGPDGRLFIAYVAYSPTSKSEVLYLARPESAVPGAPFITDTIDNQLSAADPPSVNLIVEPSGRVDIVYMRLEANSVYFATRDP